MLLLIVEIAKHIGFCVYRRSYLIWSPVIHYTGMAVFHVRRVVGPGTPVEGVPKTQWRIILRGRGCTVGHRWAGHGRAWAALKNPSNSSCSNCSSPTNSSGIRATRTTTTATTTTAAAKQHNNHHHHQQQTGAAENNSGSRPREDMATYLLPSSG